MANKADINIIIVEDEEAERLSLKAILEADNYLLETAESGAVALEKIKQHFFDVLIVDYKLPDMNGIDLIKQALAISRESVPMVVTGFGSLEIAVESMRIGAHEYIVKPINIDELKKSIESIIIERENLQKGREKLVRVIKDIAMPETDAIVIATAVVADESSFIAKIGILRPFVAVFKSFKAFFWDID